jgi:methionyl-tRNA formyltransferase
MPLLSLLSLHFLPDYRPRRPALARSGGRILNTHPALLPAYPGWHGVRDALAEGVSETGCTVHLATLEMDAGPILTQRAVPVLPDDTEETLHERIKVVERELYPETVAWALCELEAGRRIGPMRGGAAGSPEESAEKEEKEEAWTRR